MCFRSRSTAFTTNVRTHLNFKKIACIFMTTFLTITARWHVASLWNCTNTKNSTHCCSPKSNMYRVVFLHPWASGLTTPLPTFEIIKLSVKYYYCIMLLLYNLLYNLLLYNKYLYFVHTFCLYLSEGFSWELDRMHRIGNRY